MPLCRTNSTVFSEPIVRAGTSRDCISMDWRGGRAANRVLGASGTNANNHIDAADFGTSRRHRQARPRQFFAGYVLEFAGHFAEKVVVVGSIGVEIRSGRLGHVL